MTGQSSYHHTEVDQDISSWHVFYRIGPTSNGRCLVIGRGPLRVGVGIINTMATHSPLLFISIITISTIVAEDNGVGLYPPLGWNTWCTEASCRQHGKSGKLHDVCNETEIKEVAEAMISNGLFQLGYRYINLGEIPVVKITHSAECILYVFCLSITQDDCWGATERDEVYINVWA